jgi:hypothetical protein
MERMGSDEQRRRREQAEAVGREICVELGLNPADTTQAGIELSPGDGIVATWTGRRRLTVDQLQAVLLRAGVGPHELD